MAEETKKDAAAEATGRAPKKKKSRPTNCAQSNKRIRRKDWYYREGKYFANKQAYQAFVVAEAAKKAKEAATVTASAEGGSASGGKSAEQAPA